jgi:hypothetical protein
MSATTPPLKDSVTPPVSTAAQATEMESEGQGQSTSVPPASDSELPQSQQAPARTPGSKRAQNVDSVAALGSENIESADQGAAADQDIDTAGTEMDEER